MKIKIIKALIRWLLRKHKYLLWDAVIPGNYHIHRNPRRHRDFI